MAKVYTLHHKVDGILHPIHVVEPENLIINELTIPGELMGPGGKPLPVKKVGIKFPMGIQIIVEEDMDAVRSVFEDAPENTETL